MDIDIIELSERKARFVLSGVSASFANAIRRSILAEVPVLAIDDVNIYGGFIDFGYRYYLSHFFFDFNVGPGLMWVNHNMIITAESYGMTPYPIHYINPPRPEEVHEKHITINFTLNLGVAF